MPEDLPICRFVSLEDGPIPYLNALDLQRNTQSARISGVISDTVYLLEHSPTVTLGRSSNGSENILTTIDDLSKRGIETVEVDRGGDVTYHAPGQLVGYPILDLNDFGRDLHRYLRNLEFAIIATLESYGLSAYVVPGKTGVWVEDRKIAAIGIKVSRWVTMHGFALNRDIDLTPMRRDIVPCGIADKDVTSLAEQGLSSSREDCEIRFIQSFCDIFKVRGNRETSTFAAEQNLI